MTRSMFPAPILGAVLVGLWATPAQAGELPGLVINEVYADPTAPTADANCDGVFDEVEDQFIEIFNTQNAEVDISGYSITIEGGEVVHTFADGESLPPHGGITIFGGGNPTFLGPSESDGVWCVAVPETMLQDVASTGALSISSEGDTIEIIDPDLTVIDSVSFGIEADGGNSMQRSPELNTDAELVPHSSIGAAIGQFSPNKRVDGSNLNPSASPTFPLDIEVEVCWHFCDGTFAKWTLAEDHTFFTDIGGYTGTWAWDYANDLFELTYDFGGTYYEGHRGSGPCLRGTIISYDGVTGRWVGGNQNCI